MANSRVGDTGGEFLCCNHNPTNTSNGSVCSYPICSRIGCREATGCTCPLESNNELNNLIPIHWDMNTTCTCEPGYSGDYCTDFDCGCSSLEFCTIMPFGESHCTCFPGTVSVDRGTCVDIDECLDNTTCFFPSTCKNKFMQYNCSCLPGYSGDGKGPNGCISICTNQSCDPLTTCTDTRFGFVCSDCPAGYNGTGMTNCTDFDECLAGISNCGLNEVCVNTNGSFQCHCKPAYFRNELLVCEDFDECTNTTICGANATCFNTDGSYNCICSTGFRGEYPNCENINECESANNCFLPENCEDTIGSYKCHCPTGHDGDGYACFAICTPESCDQLTTCSNTTNGFNCTECPTGYNGTGQSGCLDFNECEAGVSNCTTNEVCQNTNGSFVCLCKPGFNRSESICVDIDECANITICSANATCFNIDGGYSCNCSAGFTGYYPKCANINECETANNCSVPESCEDTIGSYKCYCSPGYEGDGFTCIAICTPESCDPLTTCSNNSFGFICSECPNGFNGTGTSSCIDFDECMAGASNCTTNEICNNTKGSFECLCKPGFNRSESTCVDIDECSNTSLCGANASCNNTEGNYTCHCNSGYTGDGIHCTDIDECVNSGPCFSSLYCNNTIGSYNCSCPYGYLGNGSGINGCIAFCLPNSCDNLTRCSNTSKGFECSDCPTGYSGTGKIGCSDINECTSRLSNCHSYANCTNTIGSYNCSCRPGFQGDGFNCEDIDECKSNATNTCVATCINEIGSYRCGCPEGYTGNGVFCNDIDECRTRVSQTCPTCMLANCSSNANCFNSIGSFKCICKPGYRGDGHVCEDVNECTTNVCDDNAICTNLNGGYSCTCNAGFSGDGNSCFDINECDMPFICPAGSACENTPGNYSCSCPAGYYFTKDKGCADVDECENKNICEKHCRNIPGSYSCLDCPYGYALVDSQCQDVDECANNERACDIHVQCTNTNGSYICSECPFGYNGIEVCQPLCGDGNCDESIAENCVTCPLDCKNATCGKCGDAVCDPNETCTSCPEDCTSTCPIKSTCDECKNGRCINGQCICVVPWLGPSCSHQKTDILITMNDKRPMASITEPSARSQITISIKRLTERDSKNGVVNGVSLQDNIFEFKENSRSRSATETWQYSIALNNSASIEFIRFNEPTIYSFYNKTTVIPSKTLKVNFKVTNWPFKSIYNTLDVEIDSESSQKETNNNNKKNCETEIQSDKDAGGNLAWVKITLNGIALIIYAQFIPNAVIDGRNRLVKFSLANPSTVAVTLPHFWQQAEFDPQYTVLVQPLSAQDEKNHEKVDECGKIIVEQPKKNDATPIIIAVVVVVVVAILVAIAVIVIKKKQLLARLAARRAMKRMVYESPAPSPSLEMEPLRI